MGCAPSVPARASTLASADVTSPAQEPTIAPPGASTASDHNTPGAPGADEGGYAAPEPSEELNAKRRRLIADHLACLGVTAEVDQYAAEVSADVAQVLARGDTHRARVLPWLLALPLSSMDGLPAS